MSMQALRGFIGQATASNAAFTALGALLDAKASGGALDPKIDAAAKKMVAAFGLDTSALEAITPQEAAPLLAEIRHTISFNRGLLFAGSQKTSWSYEDPAVLQECGDFSRIHAVAISNGVIPACEGLKARFEKPGAAFLDVGVGVAGTAIAMAEKWPSLRIVGIDVWQPSLALARENVAKAGLRDRIELREQPCENLTEENVFDLAWLPTVFMPERVVPNAFKATLRALKPGGWAVAVMVNVDAVADPLMRAAMELRLAMFGGPMWNTKHMEKVLGDAGFESVRLLPSPPGNPAAFVVGRRAT
jgi:predicted O-methyltransferase YrrM